jgi:RimJ/RimL family protein N-acetyltransferase
MAATIFGLKPIWRPTQRFISHFSFLILHSSFFILHSSFFILHSSFFILHFSFLILHSSFHMNPLSFFRLETESVVIRCYTPADAFALSDVVTRSREHLLPWMPWAKNESDHETYLKLIRTFMGEYHLGIHYVMGVFDPIDGHLIAGTGLHQRVGADAFEIGYWVDVHHIRLGYATHIAGALTKAAFEYAGVGRMNIHMQPANTQSEAIPKKLGYRCDGILRKHTPSVNGDLADALIYTMTREEYDANDLKLMPLKAFDFAGRLLEPKPLP